MSFFLFDSSTAFATVRFESRTHATTVIQIINKLKYSSREFHTSKADLPPKHTSQLNAVSFACLP